MASTSTDSASVPGRPPFFSSPGTQRWLLFGSAAIFAAGIALFLALVVFPSHSGATRPTAPAAAAKVQPKAKAKVQPKAKPVPASAAAIAVGRRFIESAVLRKNLASSYSLVTSALNGGLTKQQWETGNIPVTPFPAGNAATTAFQVMYSHRTSVLFQLMLVERAGAKVNPPELKFRLGLERAGGKPNGRWLVDYWQPAYTVPIMQTP